MKTLPLPPICFAIQAACTRGIAFQSLCTLYAQGAVTIWSNEITRMPALHARARVGLRAVDEPASARIASGFRRMMSFRELSCACTVVSTFWILRSTRPASGPFDTDTLATRSICWRQSLPRKLLDR